ncbi:MAG: methyltransferase domain-containing protein [Candidatus Methanoperedens sp.]|nr:methyltransferase domain-containing protein [Candidatus Methanoperedens sp.]
MTNLKLDTPLLAEKYDELSNIQFDNGSILIEKLGIKEGDRVLDIGCGTGRLVRYVSNVVGSNGKVVGIDPLPLRIDIARQKIKGENISFEVGVSEDLGLFEGSSFDLIYLNAVFHWVVNKEATLTEIYRVLKPGGRIGINTQARESPGCLKLTTDSVLSRQPYAKAVVSSEDPMIKHAVTSPELKRLLEVSGFRNISLELRKTKRYYQNSGEIIDLVTSSSFGNYLIHVPVHLQEQAAFEIATELEKARNEKGIEFISNNVFAFAQK